MTTLCNRILGLNTITGIYKITNQVNNKCYIGQSVDISKLNDNIKVITQNSIHPYIGK